MEALAYTRFGLLLAMCSLLASCASTSGSASTEATDPRATHERCLSACWASHCADDIGGACYHACNPGNLADGEDSLLAAAEYYETVERCPYVEYRDTPPDASFVAVEVLAYEGERAFVEERLTEDARRVHANVVANVVCALSGASEPAASEEREHVTCSATAYRDPSRATP